MDENEAKGHCWDIGIGEATFQRMRSLAVMVCVCVWATFMALFAFHSISKHTIKRIHKHTNKQGSPNSTTTKNKRESFVRECHEDRKHSRFAQDLRHFVSANRNHSPLILFYKCTHTHAHKHTHAHNKKHGSMERASLAGRSYYLRGTKRLHLDAVGSLESGGELEKSFSARTLRVLMEGQDTWLQVSVWMYRFFLNRIRLFFIFFLYFALENGKRV